MPFFSSPSRDVKGISTKKNEDGLVQDLNPSYQFYFVQL